MAEKLTTTSHSGNMFKLPSSIYEAHYLSQKKSLHRGMEMVRNSLLAHRSCNQAIIFLYGLSGAGKTSSLNHLFGFGLINIKKKLQSDTKVVTEYVATMESQFWGVSNLQIGFIDVPGWGDSDSAELNIKNMAMIETFISKHPHLGSTSNIYKCYPNIVTIAINANDKRLKGENAQVVDMFRALTKLNIVDKKRPNVMIILTNIDSIGKKTFSERLNEIKTAVKDLVMCYLHVEPVIVYVENDYEELDLEKDGDWTVLKDGTLQPENVFVYMMGMLSRHQDEVGQEAVRIYFTSRGNNKPVKRQCESSEPTKHQMKKWSMIIAQEFSTLRLSEVNQALQKYIHSNPTHYSVNSLVLLMVELEDHSLTQLNTLQSISLNDVQTILLPYKMSKLEDQALVEACGVKPLKPSDLLRHVGYGVRAETGEATNYSVFELVKCDWHVKNGIRLPRFMDVVVSKDKRRIEWQQLNEDLTVAEEIKDLTGLTERPKVIPKYRFQVIHNIYTIKISLEEHELVPHLNPMFKTRVSNLPATSIEEDNLVRKEYTDLLDMYGEWVVPACGFGGIIQGELEINETEFNESQKYLDTYIDNLLDRLESSDGFQSKRDTVSQESTTLDMLEKTVALEWKGGKHRESNLTLNSLTPKLWDEWIISLNEFPIPLTKDSNRPIHFYVSLLNTLTATQVKSAYPTAYRDQLLDFQGSPQRSLTIFKTTKVRSASRETLAMEHISSTLSKANGGFPDSVTVIRGTSKESQTKYISKIQLGDTVLCRNPWELKYKEVSKINCTEEGKDLEYLFFKHEHGELLIGYEHTILHVLLFPVPRFRMVLAKDIQIGDYLVFIDKENNRELKSKVIHVGTMRGKGHYSLKIEDGVSDIAVNQVLTGDEEAACFPGNATVLLKGGKRVRMDELELGSSVLSIHPTTSKPVYSKVYIWGHRDPHTIATFLHITHPHGHLDISADHLILSGDEKTPVPAHELRAGDVIYIISLSISQHKLLSDANRNDGDSYSLIPVPVLHIHTCMHLGYYAPFTNNGLIVVDDVATSVYSQMPTRSRSNNNSWVRNNITKQLVLQFGMHRVSQYVLTPVRMVCELGMDSVINEQMNKKSNIHKYCQWLLDNF